jgi:hypothetical protein
MVRSCAQNDSEDVISVSLCIAEAFYHDASHSVCAAVPVCTVIEGLA